MKKLKYLLWIPIPLLLFWALKDVQFQELFNILVRLTPLQVAALLVVNFLFVLVLTLRWAVILRGLGAPVGIIRLLSYRLAGYAVSYLTPGPQFGGEPLQLYLAKKKSSLSYELGSASILLDKTFELLGNFAFLGLAFLATLPLGLLSTSGLKLALPLPSLLIALPAAYLTATFFGIRPLSWCVGRLPAGLLSRPRIGKADALIRSSETRIVAYCRRRSRTLLQILLFFLLVWAISLAEMRMVLHFLGVSVNLRQTLLILAGGKFAFLLPFPGALGALELTYVAVFDLLNYGAEAGISLVLYMRARDLIFAAAGLIIAGSGWKRGTPVSS
ncbi:MAG: flippase-like domain-containing protein [Spirochaetaceae bacterium]|nr:MAG: flippase-like domain-containing protein [Spirochaetaceae bacterium]